MLERSFSIASCPEEIEKDGVVYERDLGELEPWVEEIRDRREGEPTELRQVTRLPQRGFQGESFSSMQFEPGLGREHVGKVPRGERWSYDADDVPVITSQAQQRAFNSMLEETNHPLKWDRDGR